VALDKSLQTMNAAERISYTVRVAKQYLPTDVAARLQALMTPQTIVALAAYAGSHALGVGFIGDGLGLTHMLAGTREGLRQFDTYLRTTMQAKHPMELVNAGRQLSELTAPLMVDGGTMLAAFGVGRVAAALRIGGRPADLVPSRGVPGVAGQYPAVGALQAQLARNPAKALQTLKTLVEGGAEVTPQNIHYAMQLNLAALKNSNGRLTDAAKTYLREFMPWADSLLTQLSRTSQPPAIATVVGRSAGAGGELVPTTTATKPAPPTSQAANGIVPFAMPPAATTPTASASTPLTGDPYDTLRIYGEKSGQKIPTTLTPQQINIANAHSLTGQLQQNRDDPEFRQLVFLGQFSVGNADHLRRWPDGSLSVRQDSLNFNPRASYDLLVQDLGGGGVGEHRLNRMINALVMGHDQHVGLRALANAWLEASKERKPPPWPALTATRIVQLGQIIFNDASFSTLRHIQSLFGTETQDYRGILHFIKDIEAERTGQLSHQSVVLRGQFLQILELLGVNVSYLARISNSSITSIPSIPIINQQVPTEPDAQSSPPWALVVSEYPSLADLNLAELFVWLDHD
jgi:hypothetical protein